MRKIVSLVASLMLLCALVYGQAKTITGQVRDEKGDPIPYASVAVKGSKKGISSDNEGRFIIQAADGAVLIITATGFKPVEVAVSGAVVNANMVKSDANSLPEVVVSTAFNIKRAQRNVSYASQTINSEQLNTIRHQNLNSALAGKIAGLQLREQSAVKLGNAGTVRLRGEVGVAGASSGSILYVVDGTPMNNTDINPDDVEDVTVLQGVNATAIFGDRASGGAIVITTKKSRPRKGIGLEINQGLRFDKIYILPKYQNDYAGGAAADLIRFDWAPGMPTEWQALDGKYYHDYTDDASWGPRLAGQEYIPWYAWYPGHKYSFKTAALLPQPDNVRDFYGTGVTSNNNINFTKVGEGYALRTSYTYLDVKGLEPNSKQQKHTFNAGIRYDLSSHFTVTANFNYINQILDGEFSDAYANQGTGSFNSWFHRNLDLKIIKELRGYRAPDNLLPSWNHMNPGAYVGNPRAFYTGNYWFNYYDYYDNIGNTNRRDRLVGDVTFNYKMNSHFNVAFTVRKNNVTSFGEGFSSSSLDPKSTTGAPLNNINIKASYATGSTFAKEDNFELISGYNNKWGDFALNANAGATWRKNQTKNLNLSTRDGLNVPDLLSLNNSVSTITFGNARVESEVRSVFGRADIGFRNYLFAEATIRNDWFSTLFPSDNAILYKSFGGSFIFSDLIKDAVPFLNYGKLRASWGEVPTSLPAYLLGFTYGVGADQWNGNFLMGTPNTLVDPKLRGSTNAIFEVGLELRFLKNRITTDITYYDETRTDEPIGVAITGTSGFTNKLINVGKAIRQGIQVQLTTQNVKAKNFGWNTTVNFSYDINNEVVEIAEGIDRIVLSAGAFSGSSSAFTANFPGQRWGQMTGYGLKRNDQGLPLVTASGIFVRTDAPIQFGSVLPDFTGGFLNQFTYKNFIANVNIDFQKGGKYFSLSDFWGSFSGLTARTAELNDKGIPIRDPVSNGGGVHVVGVSSADGRTPVDMYVDAQTYHHQFRGANISEMSVYELTYVKMREVSIGYRIPVNRIGSLSKVIQNATFSVVARNPWLIYTPNRDFDPGEIASVYGEDGQAPGTRSLGFNLKLGF